MKMKTQKLHPFISSSPHLLQPKLHNLFNQRNWKFLGMRKLHRAFGCFVRGELVGEMFNG
jgi:hypothetical protein